MQAMVLHYIEGFLIGASLIIAIGAQNAFVLKQGLKRKFLFITALFCSVADALLISAGVLGMGTLFDRFPTVTKVIAFGGAAYLVYFGITSFIAVFKDTKLEAAGTEAGSLLKLLATLALFTFLNPHVYLDTVIMMGSIASTKTTVLRPFFAAGAISASFAWFFGLTYGGTLLQPLFAKKLSWKILDTAIGCIMFFVAVKLCLFGVGI